jgi:undecaprenyl-diphosphatase
MILSEFSTLNEIILAIFLGLIQGVTEFLPVSSTAHMRLLSQFLVGKDFGLTTSNIIQLGSLAAILQYFWKDIEDLFKRMLQILQSPRQFNFFIKNASTWVQNRTDLLDSSKETGLDVTLTQLIVGTFPILVVALLFRNFVEEVFRQNILWIGVFLAAGAALMAFSDYWFASFKERNLKLVKTSGEVETASEEIINQKSEHFTIYEVLTIGIFQSLAIFPGISRSGATLSGALLLAKERRKSVRFSFLLSIPAIGLSGIYDVLEMLRSNLFDLTFLPAEINWAGSEILLSVSGILIATFLSYFVGLFFLRWLLKYLANHTTSVFVLYRIFLAITIVLFMVIV